MGKEKHSKFSKILEAYKADKQNLPNEESHHEIVDDEETKTEELEAVNEQIEESIDHTSSELLKLHNEVKELNEENEFLANKLAEIEKQQLNDQQQFYEALINPVNTIDQIASAYRNSGAHELVAEQLEKVAELTIQQLVGHGIEEIPIYGKEIDGAYMESFGPAQNVKESDLAPHSVAIIIRRAFKVKGTEDIIQNALVYTTPEE